MRRLWITDEPWPATQHTLDAAAQAGATEVLHGIPQSLADTIPPGTTGYWEVEIDTTPPAPTAEERLADLLAALADAQSLEEIRQAAATAGGQ